MVAEEYVTTKQAAEDAGVTTDQLNAYLGRHGVPRYVKVEDLDYARATAGQQGGAGASACVDKAKGHRWDKRTREEDPLTHEPLVWCGRKGCGVGVVRVPRPDGKATMIYRHRPT